MLWTLAATAATGSRLAQPSGVERSAAGCSPNDNVEHAAADVHSPVNGRLQSGGTYEHLVPLRSMRRTFLGEVCAPCGFPRQPLRAIAWPRSGMVVTGSSSPCSLALAIRSHSTAEPNAARIELSHGSLLQNLSDIPECFIADTATGTVEDDAAHRGSWALGSTERTLAARCG